ncbi:YcaO-like family protein [Sinorhizobium fredii]|uniref:YcaO-like family protein n=1 Tax=Rhizobium fredii TaxID=380 RepID=UPI0013E8BA26|nr:YcaO-like family protein [Sinorhizobium fredii]
MSSGADRSRLNEGLADFHTAIFSDLRAFLSITSNPEETKRRFQALLPLCRRARITRIGDLTGLDRLGLPVVQAVRPAALSEVTSLGRGLTTAEASMGAIMESLERYYAEAIPAERVFLATAEELEIADGLFDNLVVARSGNWRTKILPWIAGLDVATGHALPVPVELVHTRYTDPPPVHDGWFARTTTGLACHMEARGAYLHGLFECVERDAIARAFATHGFFDRMRIAVTGLGQRVDHIRAIAEACGISFALWHAPSPAGIPVIWCQTIETGPGEPILALPTEGYAAGPSVEAAAASAMLEALAARAGAISGARDDQTRAHYKRSTEVVVARARELIVAEGSARPIAPAALPAFVDSGSLLNGIVAAGLGPVVAVPVGHDRETGVRCVRTVLARAYPFNVVR